jgi:exopolysaccharide biosynthesis protein
MGVDSAMRMDGGGSTAMWVAGQPSEGIVSNPGRGERQIFNGIFIGT